VTLVLPPAAVSPAWRSSLLETCSWVSSTPRWPVAYRIDEGTGMLTDATGIIDSNFLVNLTTSELIDTHLGIIRTP